MYQYPYGNAQQLNLDWLMEQWQEVKQSIDGSLQGEIDRVEAAITDLLAARDAAVAAAGAANTSAGAAAQSAQAAAADAATATAQAAAATQERVNAAQAANNAQSYAGNAQTQAAAAQNAAGQAAASASKAAADASDAHDDALAASGSAVNAAASAAGALQNFQLSDAARQAAQDAAQDAQDVLDSIPEDYSELSDDVNQLQSDLNELQDDSVPMKNLIDFSKCTMGYELQNTIGQVRAAPNWYVTDWIEVEPNTAYALSGLSSKFKAEVNAEKTEYTGIQGTFETYFITGSNTKYVRFNSLIAGYSTPQLEKGTVITPYEPFALIPSAFPIIAKTIPNMTADKALAVNDFRIVNNTLYKITSPIASGGTLIPNTNCTETTIAAVIKTLLS